MRVLHVTPAYFPATSWGGPIWSTKAICDGIAAVPEMELRVLTTDAAGPDVRQRVTPAAFPYPVHYARRIAGHSFAPGLFAQLLPAVAWAEVVHLTGTYSAPTLPTLALARIMNRPVVWSPRGALQATAEWADSPRRQAKHLFEGAAQFVRPSRTILHVTARSEAEQSTTRLPGIKTTLIPNAIDVPARLPSQRPDDGRCKLVFLGRLHPKKGLDMLFDAMARLPDRFVLDVYGDGAPDYVRSLADRARKSHGRIRMHGHVEEAAKTQALAGADLFVLPSHSENFGIAVAEALAHATPVLTTDATPWGDVQKEGCGRCIALADADLADEILGLAAQDLATMGWRGRAWMARDFSPETMVTRFQALYADCAGLIRQEVTA